MRDIYDVNPPPAPVPYTLPRQEVPTWEQSDLAVPTILAVLLFVGDNLRDFDDRFRCRPLAADATGEQLAAAVKGRYDEVDQCRANFADRWVILPNPAYGEWTKPLGRGAKDLDRLVGP